MRTLEAMRPKKFTKFINEDLSVTSKDFIQPGTISAQNAFQTFIVGLLTLLPSITADSNVENEGPSCRSTTTTHEDCPYATERAAGSYIRLLQEIQLLVYEGFARRTPAT